MIKITTDLKQTLNVCSPLSEQPLTQECKAMWENIEDMIDLLEEKEPSEAYVFAAASSKCLDLFDYEL